MGRKKASNDRPLYEIVEQAVANCIGDIPELRTCSEHESVAAVIEGLEVYLDGQKMRLHEIEADAGE